MWGYEVFAEKSAFIMALRLWAAQVLVIKKGWMGIRILPNKKSLRPTRIRKIAP